MRDFERDTRVQKNNDGYSAELSPSWEIWGPNGGYIASIALRAAGDAALIKRPVTFHGHYLRVARFEPVHLDVTVVHRGSRSESIRVSMLQNAKLIFEGVLRTSAISDGLLYDDAGESSKNTAPPPTPESLPVYEEFRNRFGEAFWKNFERRLIHTEYLEESFRTESACFEEWVRVKSESAFTDPFVDAGRSVVLLDTFTWPAVFRKMGDEKFVAVSLDITVLFHQSSAESRWLRVDMHAPIAKGGVIAGQGRTFDEHGRTIASGSSQMLCVPAPQRL